jgi:hypothetical protein
MNGPTRRAARLLLSPLWLVIVAMPARAQFDEPDTIPRFSIGPSVELVFRGKRGELGSGTEISFGGGPPLGVRLEYRLSRTLSLGAAGSWGRLDERLEGLGARASRTDGLTQFQFSGELLLRVKPSVPGYFILGGGARRVDADGNQPDPYLHDVTAFSEPLGIIGAGVELSSRRRRTLKLDLRFYLVSPAEQIKFETKSLATDFALGFSLMFRI